MGRIDQHAAVPERGGIARQADPELVGPLEVPVRRTARTEDLDLQGDAPADRHAAGLKHTVRAARERHEGGGRIFNVNPAHSACCRRRTTGPAIADGIAARQRALLDERGREAWTESISPRR